MTQEVKVGSLWLEKDTNAIIKVLSICGDAAFIQVNDDPNGIAFYLDRITKNCTPYTPPRRCEGWVNIHQPGRHCVVSSTIHPNEEAGRYAGKLSDTYIATVKIEYEEQE